MIFRDPRRDRDFCKMIFRDRDETETRNLDREIREIETDVVFKCFLILGPKCYFGSELRYSNEITLYQRNLAFRSEMSHFASEWIIMRPNGWFRTHNGHFGPIMAHFGPIIGMV